MRNSSGEVIEVTASVKKEKDSVIGQLKIVYGSGDVIVYHCLRTSPCEWRVTTALLNEELSSPVSQYLIESAHIGILEEALQIGKGNNA